MSEAFFLFTDCGLRFHRQCFVVASGIPKSFLTATSSTLQPLDSMPCEYSTESVVIRLFFAGACKVSTEACFYSFFYDKIENVLLDCYAVCHRNTLR
jgi:hypothetical protein